MHELPVSILESFAPVDEEKAQAYLKEAIDSNPAKLVVLDDDPTGVQTVHDISVYTDWSRESIRSGFAEANKVFYILTNSRGMTGEESKFPLTPYVIFPGNTGDEQTLREVVEILTGKGKG